MKGQVISKDSEGNVTVALMQGADENCKACGMGDSCGLPKVEKLDIPAGKKTQSLKVDQYVDVEISSKMFLWLSGAVYIVPLLTMLFGAILGHSVRPEETGAIIGAVAGFSIGVVFNIFLNKQLTLSKIVDIKILEGVFINGKYFCSVI